MGTLISAAVAGDANKKKKFLELQETHEGNADGFWEAVSKDAAPLRTMQIIDGTSRLIRAQPVTFQANEIDEEAFGWNMPNEALLTGLQSKLDNTSTIQHINASVSSYDLQSDGVTCHLDSVDNISANLILAADGRNSLARQAAGIETQTWNYPQVALVLSFAHSRPHANISTEFHTETGPFTMVPLPKNRSSLVWALRQDEVDGIKALSDAELSLRMEQKMHSMLGKIKVDTPRQFYPLSGQTPSRFAANRVMLVGEAAHVFPPIGAQGLNLGLRDVEESVSAASKTPDDPGSDTAMRSYDTARRSDVLMRTGAVDALNRSLLSDFLPVQMARSLGLGLLSSLPPLRGLFMREGLRPGSGLKAMLTHVGKRSTGR